jgi:hypothetical protein
MISKPGNSFLHGLRDIGLELEKYKLQGSLVIVEAGRAYFSLTNKPVDITIMIRMLLKRQHKLGKSGRTIFSDMGLFFGYN